jgi:hypothetical protein
MISMNENGIIKSVAVKILGDEIQPTIQDLVAFRAKLCLLHEETGFPCCSPGGLGLYLMSGISGLDARTSASIAPVAFAVMVFLKSLLRQVVIRRPIFQAFAY